MWIGQQAPSLGLVILLLLATTQIYKQGDYEWRIPFYGAQYQLDLLHQCRQLPLDLITQKTLIQNFT